MTPGSDVLDLASRAGALARLRAADGNDPLDILVVGGGVVGCGSALDAAARGLSVGLVERRDLASGTSSRSSRLAHGGLRYLEQREFALVHEALTERGLLLDKLAPHLVQPVPFLFPVTRRGWERPYVGFGVTFYDLLSRLGAYGVTLPRPKTLSLRQVAGVAPGLRTDALVGAARYYDAQIDDARFTVALARTAAAHGAAVATRTAVTRLLREEGRVVGAVIRDEIIGSESPVRARVVLSAAGVWTDDILALAGAQSSHAVRQSKGVHLVVRRDAFRSTSALIARTPTSVLFLLPWGRYWLVGTTDTDYTGDRNEPTVDTADVDYLIEQANRWLAIPLTRQNVVGIYAGLRPLLSAGVSADGTSTLSREHAVLHPAPGLVAIAGGKFTTYRVMAADAVDQAVLARAEVIEDQVGPSVTAELPVVGAPGFRQLWANRERMAREAGMPLAMIEQLLRRHGDRTRDVLDLVAADPRLGELLHPEASYLLAEAVVAVAREGALSLTDILIRRTRVALETQDGGTSVARRVAELVAPQLGWNAERIESEIVLIAARHESMQPVPGGTGEQQEHDLGAELAGPLGLDEPDPGAGLNEPLGLAEPDPDAGTQPEQTELAEQLRDL